MANVQLLKDTLAAIEADRSRFNMERWIGTPDADQTSGELDYDNPEDELCKTQMCLAGHALLVAGAAKIGVTECEGYDWHTNKHIMMKFPAFFSTENGMEIQEFSVPHLASDLLEFEPEEAEHIFFATEIATVEQLRERCELVLGISLR